jgi:uncharacterized membrane protein YhdT
VSVVSFGRPAARGPRRRPSEELAQLGATLGFPSWFFWSGIVVAFLFSVLPVLIVKRFFTDVSIEAEQEGQ